MDGKKKLKPKKVNNVISIDKREKKIRLGNNIKKSYNIGELLIKFLEADFSEFEAERQDIIAVLNNSTRLNDELNSIKGSYTKLIKNNKLGNIPTGYSRHYTYVGNLSPCEPDTSFYVKHRLFNALDSLKGTHPYFEMLDYDCFGATDYVELINNKYNISSLQGLFRIALDYCLNRDCDDKLKEYSGLQRYSFFKEAYDNPFKTDRINAGVFYDTVLEDGKGAFLTETVFGYDIASLLYIEFFQMISLNILVAVCSNCQKYFILKGMYHSLYCDRILEGGTRTCRQIGALKKFKKKVRDNRVYNEYERVYKRIYARKRLGIIDADTHKQLKAEIDRLREDVLGKKITIDVYKAEMEKI